LGKAEKQIAHFVFQKTILKLRWATTNNNIVVVVMLVVVVHLPSRHHQVIESRKICGGDKPMKQAS
jgi:hypothetical protein